ncbi:hypothetical protein D3C78_1123030 [compost metagenome]
MIGSKLGAGCSLALFVLQIGGHANEFAALGFKHGRNTAVTGCGAVDEIIVAHRSDAGATHTFEVPIHHFEGDAADLQFVKDRHAAHCAVRIAQRGGDDIVLQADIGRKTNCRHAERDQADRQRDDLASNGLKEPVVHETVPQSQTYKSSSRQLLKKREVPIAPFRGRANAGSAPAGLRGTGNPVRHQWI